MSARVARLASSTILCPSSVCATPPHLSAQGASAGAIFVSFQDQPAVAKENM